MGSALGHHAMVPKEYIYIYIYICLLISAVGITLCHTASKQGNFCLSFYVIC